MPQATPQTRRLFLSNLGLIGLGAMPALAQQNAPPVPPRVSGAIKQAEKLRKAGKFSEALSVLEKRLKALGITATKIEKSTLNICVADVHRLWAMSLNESQAQSIKFHLVIADEIYLKYQSKNIAKTQFLLGAFYFSQNRYDISLDYLFRAIKYIKSQHQPEGEILIWVMISNIYTQKDLSDHRAVEYLRKALSIAKSIHNKDIEFSILENLANTFTLQSNLISILTTLSQMLSIARD